MIRAAISLALGLLIAGPAGASCRLALVLALDVSASVDGDDYILQRDGLARALDAPVIRNAILNGAPGDVALYVFEWSGRQQQDEVVGWTRLTSPGAIDRVVAAVAGHRRKYKDFPTAIGYALGHAAGRFAEAPACDRKVIDISGDGPNNEGFAPRHAYAHFPFGDVTVNGLVIESGQEGALRFYLDEVARGPGSFIEYADGFEDFEAAMGRKLFREINGMVVGWAEGAQWPPG